MPAVALRGDVTILIQNIGGRDQLLFDSRVSPGELRPVKVPLNDLQHPGWNTLILGLQRGDYAVIFPNTGGLAEKLVEAALRQISAVSLLYANTGDDEVAGTTSEVDFPMAKKRLDPGFWLAGKNLRVKASGVLTTAAGAVEPTIVFRVRLGSSLLLSTGALTLPAGYTAQPWSMEANILCREASATGKLMVTGFTSIALAGSSTSLANNAVASLDTNVQNYLRLTTQWSDAVGGESATLQNFTLDVVGRVIDVKR